jgi:DNA sulfur modification protein DndD
VSPYFFFDGEKIDQFARPGHEEQVKSGIRNVLKIEVLERARTHLTFVAREYQRELRKQVSGRLQTLLETQEHLRDDFERQRRRLSELRSERSTAQRQLQDIDQRLSEIAEARKWDEQRKQVTALLREKEQQKQRLWAEIREVTNRSFISLARPALAKALTVLDEKRERGEIPPGIREQFIQDLLAQRRCICGRPVIENSEEYHKLCQLLSKSVSSELENAVIQTAGDLRALLSASNDILEQVRIKMREKASIDADLELLTQQLDEISRHLQEFDHEEVSNLEKKRTEWNEQIVLLAGEIGRVEERVERLRIDLDRIESEIEKAEVSERKAKGLQRRFSLASRAADAADRMCDVFATEMRRNIQSEAKAIFQKLIWKDSQFQDISLSEDYRLEVYDRWGLPARRELSAGERQVLSLAFITGMAKVAGEEAPLVMDTPFGRLSSSHRGT